MRKYRYYRHRDCLDIDILVEKISYVGNDYIKLKVFYVAQRNRDLLYNTESQTIRIQHKDQKNWKYVE